MGKNISVSTTENVNEVGLNQKTKYDADFKAQVIEVWRSGAYQTIVECAKSYSILLRAVVKYPTRSLIARSKNGPLKYVKLGKYTQKIIPHVL